MNILQHTESDEQREIRESVRKLAEREIPKYQNENFYGTLPKDLFKSLAELGLTGLPIEERWNGIGDGAETCSIVMEELARVDLGPAVFLSVHWMVARLIQMYANEEQSKLYMPKLASGELLAAYALTEPGSGSDASGMTSTALVTDDGFILNGGKTYISSAGWADLYLVFAKVIQAKGQDLSQAPIAAFIVDANTKGLIVGTPEKKMGCELSPISTLTFEDLHLNKASLLGDGTNGYKIALSGLSAGRINIAACANGLALGSLQIALDYIKERKQFDQSLIEFQGLQFMVADMRTKLEAARLLTREAAAAIDNKNGRSIERTLSSMAKLFATDSAMQVTTDAVQLLGGAGYIKEYKVERFMRDAKMLQIVEGTNQIQRMIITREMTEEGYKV